MVWNCAGLVVTCLTGFVVAPFLVHQLGDTDYGLWIVIGSLTSCCGLLELGVRGSVGRHVAFYRAREDWAGLNETLNTGLVLLAGLGLLGLAAILAVMPWFFDLFKVPDLTPDQAAGVRLALVIVGINFALSLVLDAFDATLWGCQRFDWLNFIEIPTALIRTGLTFYFIGRGYGLVALALIISGTTLAGSLAKVFCCFVEEPALRLKWALVRRRAFLEILGYSFWTFVGTVARMARTSLGPLLIGNILVVALITPYAVAGKLITLATNVLVAATGVVTPWATDLYAQNQEARQRLLFLLGSRHCFALSLYLFSLFLLLGKPLIVLWMGPALVPAFPLLVVLALGELLPNSQYVTNSVILAAARHRALAFMYLTETVAGIILTVVLTRSFGVMGACVAVAAPAVLCRGITVILHGCRLSKVSLTRYLIWAICPALAWAVVPGVVLAGLVAAKMPQNWGMLVLETGLYTLAFAGMGLFFIGFGPLHHLEVRWGKRIARLVGGPAPEPVADETEFHSGVMLRPEVTCET
ncbi:MAG: oligosaccharide flippase family protein [Planctomycetes bacterium]|nr:oligosaccharide flippase family protein [Planctomycetota bacterium]